MSDSKKTFDGISPAAQEQWRELAVLPPAQALSRLQQGATSAPMTSLPKRGDRVRVTEVIARVPLSPEVGDEVTLSCDAREESSGIVFMFWGNGRDGGGQWHSGYVKVEILERAHASKVEIIERDGYKFTLTCRKCGLAMKLEAGPLKRHDTTIDTCALCDEKRAEFARGMRRAVRIAERLREPVGHGMVSRLVDVSELKEAVEKELADG